MQRGAEPLQQQCTSQRVSTEQSHTALTVGEAKHPDLMGSGITVPRHDELQHCVATVVARSLGDEGLSRIAIQVTNSDRPSPLQRGDQTRQLIEPPSRVSVEGLVTDYCWNIEHRLSIPH